MNDMESVYDANSLLDAFNKSKKGTAWKESVQRYEMNLLRNINQTQKEIWCFHGGQGYPFCKETVEHTSSQVLQETQEQ